MNTDTVSSIKPERHETEISSRDLVNHVALSMEITNKDIDKCSHSQNFLNGSSNKKTSKMQDASVHHWIRKTPVNYLILPVMYSGPRVFLQVFPYPMNTQNE